MPHIQKAPPPNKALLWLALIVFALALIISLQSCNTLKRAETKALKPYVNVLTDIDTSFKKKKQDLLAAIVDAKMPNKAKKETITRYIQGKQIIVKDTSSNKRLRDYYERQYLGKLCFTGEQLDSMVNAAIDEIEPTVITRTDTIDNSSIETIIDTTGNYYRNKNFYEQKQLLILTETNLQACSEDLKELQAQQQSLSYLAKSFFGEVWNMFWWVFLLVVLGGVAFKIIKNKIL